jgi:hypothetical protein
MTTWQRPALIPRESLVFDRVRSARVRSRWWTVLIAAVLAVAGALHGAPEAIASPDGSATRDAGRPIEGLPPAAQAHIAATIGADDPDYHVRQQPNGARASRPSCWLLNR